MNNSFPERLELDGVFFRVNRNNKYFNICFSDLTENEQNEILEKMSPGELKRMCIILSQALRTLGEEGNTISHEEMLRELGVTHEDLAAINVELE